MKRNRRARSIAGLFVTLCMLPLLLANMACMDPLPVPVGDSERSRIDPRLNGMWVGTLFEVPYILVFDSFDKRAWLMSAYGFGVDVEGEEPETEWAEETPEVEPATAAAWLDALHSVTIDEQVYWNYKTWKTKLRGTEFLTWEAGLVFDEDGLHKANLWYVWKLEWLDKDSFELYLVNDEFEDIGEVTKRSQAERIIKRNLKNPDLFEEETYRFHRIEPVDHERAVELLSDAVFCSFDEC